MDSINENKVTEPFPFESLRRFRNTVAPDIDKTSQFSARSYDNRGRISDVAAALQSKLGYFQTRLSSSAFLSDAFSWQVKTAKSSDSSILLAKASSDAGEKDYSLNIDSLATARTAVSEHLVSDEVTEFETGTYSYTLTLDSETYSIDVDVENSDEAPLTNRSVLRDLERSINNLGIDVTARLVDTKVRDYNPYRENAYKDMSYLVISGVSTGDEIDFSLADTSGTLIEDLNLDRITQFGLENQYEVNGVSQSFDSNDITIESGRVGGYLLGITGLGENVQVNVKQGRTALSTELTQVIEDYNDLIRWIDDNESVISSTLKETLFKDLSSMAVQNKTVTLEPLEETDSDTDNKTSVQTGFSSELNLENSNSIDADLEDIGLMLNADGTLEISEDFAKSVTSNLRDVYDVLAGENGFFTKISDRIDTIHGKSESNYVFARNHVLSYDSEGTSRRSIYKANSAAIINIFA